MLKHAPLLALLAAILLAPILLRPKGQVPASANAETIVIVSPHNEAIRYEFSRAFEAWYFAKTGRRARVDWRTPGGTSEIARYVASEYVASFQEYWTRHLGRPWSKVVEASFDNPKIVPAVSSAMDSEAQAARRAFLDSKVGSRIDLFFGGGSFDFEQQAKAGRLVDCGFVAAHPELFNDRVIPRVVSGEPYWDPKGRWIGTVISSFGICYNTDVLSRLGVMQPPSRWSDLGDPVYAHEIALANPTQSGSVNKAFEMVIQQQMQDAVNGAPSGGGGAPGSQSPATAAQNAKALDAGWERAMRLLMRIGANARYFTDASTKIALDVESGEAAAGMTIDFFGRYQSEAVRRPDGSSRLQYVNAAGGTTFGVDPIGLFRGAPHPDAARSFIEFVLTPEGQKLWNWKVGAPGGPHRYALRRLPILPALYAPDLRQFRSDPDVDPYALAKTFTYHGQWTGPLFRSIAFIVRVMCIDSHDELTAAWRELRAAGFPKEATATFEDVRAVSYSATSQGIRQALAGDKIQEVKLAKELADRFRNQYNLAARQARDFRRTQKDANLERTPGLR
jgi:iron(III) transport system substrate-binding protein